MSVREPAVAGLFYPSDPAQLRESVDRLLDEAGPDDRGARAVVAPHAGYIYSGSTAAVAYRALTKADVARVAVLGPTHRVAVDGIAVPQATTWRTPLGDIEIDVPSGASGLPRLVADDRPHAPEHSLEVHVPFLQRRYPGVPIAPFAVGLADERLVGDVIGVLLDDPGTIVVVSSDLSHYLPYDEARRVDRATLDQVVALDGRLDYDQACGANPVSGLMEHARRTGGGLRELASCSSGDTAGDTRRVVGYAALSLEASR